MTLLVHSLQYWLPQCKNVFHLKKCLKTGMTMYIWGLKETSGDYITT